ncbi:MAG: RidA family protein [Clostridium butyricum]|nr:RidA family protein [Clostridium butyricum]
MSNIKRYGINKENAWSDVVVAGDFVFLNFCVGNVGQSFEAQVNGAIDDMERKLKMVNLTLENIVKLDAMLRDAWNIPIMEKVFQERFVENFPARKTVETNFAHIGGADGLHIQIDAIAYKG